MSRVQPRVLKGFRDYLPEVMVHREQMLRRVTDVFRSFGFAPLATPALEYSEILLGKYGDEGDKLLYRFEDNGGRDVSLRYDLTVPLARVIGQHGNLPRPFRRYQVAPVWRAEKPGRGRFREFVQCDVDVVGSDSLLADFEVIQVGVATLQGLGVERFEMRINDRRVLDGLLARMGIRERTTQLDVLRVVDKLPKVGWDGVAAELREAVTLEDAALEALHAFLHADLDAIDDKVVDMEVAGPGLASLRQLLEWAEALGIREHLAIDLSIARGLDYYTSTIYETFLLDLEELGSVMSGGRYDDLLSMFSGRATPAVGISLGVDRLLAGLIELGLMDTSGAALDVFVTVFSEATVGFSQRIAAAVRDAGFSAQLHLEPGQKLGKQFKAADRAGARVAIVAGPSEQERGVLTAKDLTSGDQVELELSALPTWLQSLGNT